MSQSEVFRPANGPLLVRGGLNTGLEQSADVFRKSNSMSRARARPGSQGSRPGTQSGGSSRFGQLSHSSFFARHNPHPVRVRHIKGLLDVPICAVNDDGYFANPRYGLQFPPNISNETKLKSYNTQYYNVPVGSINVNSQLHPIDTINGIQQFVGSNMTMFREKKAMPKIGMGSGNDAWKDELRALTEAVGAAGMEEAKRRPSAGNKPRTSQYSTETGRLIPPPSRAMTRGNSNRRQEFFKKLQHISDNPELETMIIQMLCQVLQTGEDVNAVQAWLVSAGDREKAMVLDMIRAALVSNEEYYKQYDHVPAEERPRSCTFRDIGKTIGESRDGDRLTLEPSPRPMERPMLDDPIMEEELEDRMRTPKLPDVFRPPSSQRPISGGHAAIDPSAGGPEPRLRYTQTPKDMSDNGPVWEPDMSH